MFGKYNSGRLNSVWLDLKSVGTGPIENGSGSPRVGPGTQVGGKIRMYNPTVCILDRISSLLF